VAELVWMAMYFMLSFLLPFHPIMVLARKREDNKYDFFDAARKKNRKIASIHIWKSKLHISAYNTFR